MLKKQTVTALSEITKKVTAAVAAILMENAGQPLVIKVMESSVSDEPLLPESSGAFLYQIKLRIQVSPKVEKTAPQ